jgi:hypothetical protein
MSKVRTLNVNQIPDELLNDKELNLQIKQLPDNYNFEIHKTIWRIKTIKAKRGTKKKSHRRYFYLFLSFISRYANAGRFIYICLYYC